MAGPVFDLNPVATRKATAKPADTRPAPSLAETVAAGTRTAMDDQVRAQKSALDRAYLEVIEALVERGQGRRGDYTADVLTAANLNPFERGMIFDGEKVWRAVERARQADPAAFRELGTREQFEINARRRNGGRDADIDTVQRGNAIASFVGAMAGEMTDPVNLGTLPVGGGGKTILTRMLTEGLVNAGIEAVQTPFRMQARELLGEEMTAGEAAFNIAAAGAGGAAIRGGIEIAPGAARVVNERVIRPARLAIDPDLPAKEFARAFERMVPENTRTPEQDAILQILRREIDIDEASPYVQRIEAIDAHRAKLTETIAAIEEGRIATQVEIDNAGTAPPPRVGPVAPRGNFADVKARIARPESAGNDLAENAMGSSAAGRYQFVKRTFVSLFEREFGTGAAAALRAWERNRFDADLQERLMDRLLEENAQVLERDGHQADAGNLYLAHFAGGQRAADVLGADLDAPVSQFFSPTEIRQNPTYLGDIDGRARTVGEAVDTIRGKVGGDPVEAPPPRLTDETMPEIREEAIAVEIPRASVRGEPAPLELVRADEIGVDAELMQFKSGGDEFGVTPKLQGIEEWDPIAAGTVMVWEGADGRRLIADGHQRLGLAKRIAAATGQDIRLNAFVLRESDGFTARDARIRAALKNIAEDQAQTQSTDVAKVFRELDEGAAEEILRRLPKRSAALRDGRAIARLEPQAFGAVVNEVIPENFGAAIGDLVDDPAQHMPMVGILLQTDPPNRAQAEAIIRQALDAGFVKAGDDAQGGLFGDDGGLVGLFAARAKLLDRTLKELRKMRGAFAVAVRNAETLEAGGNRIDVDASAAAAQGNAMAVALVERLALRKGNAINEIVTSAAGRIEAGERIAAVVRDIVAELRQLDLETVARGDDAGIRGRDGAGGSGRAGEPERPGRGDADQELTPREIDEAKARGEANDPIIDEEAGRLFDEPDGEGVRQSAESAWHDIRNDPAGEPAPATMGDQVRASLTQYGFDARGDELSMRIEGFAEEGTVSSGARVVTLRLDQQGRYLERLDGFGKVERDVDLRQFDDPQAAIEAVLGRPLPERQADFAAPTAEQRRTALERQTEGGIRPTGATRAPGEDGGLFDTRDTTGDLFDMDDGKGPRSAAAIRDELDQAKAGIEEIRKCLK